MKINRILKRNNVKRRKILVAQARSQEQEISKAQHAVAAKLSEPMPRPELLLIMLGLSSYVCEAK